MFGFLRPTNYVEDPGEMIRKATTQLRKKRSPTTSSEEDQPRRSLMPLFEAMANKTLQEFSAPTIANIRTGTTVDVGEEGFELKPALINMVQVASFVGKHMKIQVPISNTSWRYATHSPSKG